MKRTLLTALIIASIGGLTGSTARAVLSYTAGDLFLGFRASGGTGATQDYLVNIGQLSQFSLQNGASFSLSLGNIGADLTSLYGADWNTRSDVFWSVSGTDYDGGAVIVPTLYATKPRNFADLGTPSTPWKGRSTSLQTSTASQFQALHIYYTQNGTATVNSAAATFQDASADNSYAFFTAQALDFDVWQTIEGSFLNGASGTVLDYYKIDPVFNQNAARLGIFTINNAGTVTFTAVPEPATLALLAMALVIFLRIAVQRRDAV